MDLLVQLQRALEAAKKWRAKLARLLQEQDDMAYMRTARSSCRAAHFGSAGEHGRAGVGEAHDDNEEDDDVLDAGYVPTLVELDALDGYIEDLQQRIAEPGYYRRAMNSILYNQPSEVLKAREEAYQRMLAHFISERPLRS